MAFFNKDKDQKQNEKTEDMKEVFSLPDADNNDIEHLKKLYLEYNKNDFNMRQLVRKDIAEGIKVDQLHILIEQNWIIINQLMKLNSKK